MRKCQGPFRNHLLVQQLCISYSIKPHTISIFATGTFDQHEDGGYSVIQKNYEVLTETVDSYEVEHQLLYYDILTIDDVIEIDEAHKKNGRKYACEKMITCLFRTWKRNYLHQFIHVLDDCGYKECAKQLCGRFLAESTCSVLMFYSYISHSPTFLSSSLHPFPLPSLHYCLSFFIPPFSPFLQPALSSPL